MNLYLFLVLHEDVFKLLHHLSVDGLPGADVFEVKQHVERAFRGSERLERLVDEHLGLTLNGFHLLVELLHVTFPRIFVLDFKWIKTDLQLENAK